MLGSMTDASALQVLTGKTGASEDQVTSLLGSALPQLMGSMTNNASTEEGALSLAGALTQHTSTAPVAQQIAEADVVDGGKIISHILGANQAGIVSSLSSESGMNDTQVNSVLSSIAPALLSGLSSVSSTAAETASTTNGKKTGGGGGTSFGGAKLDLSDGFDIKDVLGIAGKLLSKKKPTAETNGAALLSILAKLAK